MESVLRKEPTAGMICGVIVEQGLTQHQTHYMSYWGRVYGSKDPSNSANAPKEERS